MLIPCLNEERAIGGIIESVLALGLPVIVVDDGSDDATPAIVDALPVTLIRHSDRRGKGEALRSGFREALKRGYAGVVTMDGDGQHVAADIPRLLAAAKLFPAHIITGARLINRERQPTYRRLANNFGDWGISLACGQRLIDTQSGQRYYPRAAVELVDIDTEGFVFESEILIEAAWQRGIRVASVPIESRYESSHAPEAYRLSHFRPVSDFMSITTHVVWKFLSSGRFWENVRKVRHQQPLLIDHRPEPSFAPARSVD
ncbi:MAG: glycosyltransferase family 2 protein [Xanthomonadales bacterium]|nr:glycosyltransferase family 2 protein [Xanthomonadales bacterium]